MGEGKLNSWDVFIAHASDDKKAFVERLAHRLKDLAVRVWYDDFTLVPGDRLSEKIGEGLADCRSGVLVVSRAFLKKRWTSYELSGLVNRFVEDSLRLIPIWLDVSRADVARKNPSLADLVAIKGDPKNVDQCALDILKVVRPQLHENLVLLAALGAKQPTIARVSRKQITSSPIRHHDIPPDLLVRIQNIWFALRNATTKTLNEWIECFQRDLRPAREVQIWERILGAAYIAEKKLKGGVQFREKLVGVLVRFSFGDHEGVFADVEAGKIEYDIAEAAAAGWVNVVPAVPVTDVEDTGE